MSHVPVLSVVIPAYNVEAYLGECLDSLLAQKFTDLEVIVVDDGSTDGTHSVASAFARQDLRITVLHQSNSGQGIARNLGVEHARGEFLAFIDADDTVPPRAFARMVETLRQTGSDFCVGSARRMANGRFRPTVWDQSVHTRDRFETTIAEFPLAMQDIIACNRMFRTEFWREKVGGFRGRRAYEDHVPMLTAYVRARRFDILSTVTYNWRIREDLSSTSQQKASIDNLLDRISVKEEANQLLLREASPTVYNMWVARALDIDFPPFIESALAGSGMYRGILATTYRTFLGRATPEALADVRVSQKARAWLAAEERWEDLHRAQEYFLAMRKLPTTQVEDGAIVAEHQVFLRGAPHRIRELSAVESRFDGVVDHVTPMDDGRIRISGWALVRGLDMPDPSGLEAWLVETDSVRQIPLAVETYADPQATIWARDRSARYDGGGFRVTVDPSGVPQGQWQLRIQIEQRGVTRAGALHHVVTGGSAARLITTLAV
ncbi:MAG: glycosyltransferase, partial [Nocardioides sp.]|nr:glycosyltransferase [Nocardioides sp.]